MIRTIKALGGLMLAAALVACGGGGGSSGATAGGGAGGGGGGGGGATAAAIDVFTSASQLSSSPTSSVTFSVTVKDANNQALANQPVTFSASSGSIVGSANATTGSNGEAITSVSLNTGGDQSNRNIVVTVSSGGATRQVTIPVTGTTVSLSGASSLLVGGTTTFTTTVRNSSGAVVANTPVTFTSTLGNTFTPASGTTDSNGLASFVFTGANPGNDVVTATAAGTSASASVLVSAVNLGFTAPTVSAAATLPIATAVPVTVHWANGGAAVVGGTVTFSTTRGTVTAVTTTTNGSGDASTTLSSTSAGPATITASTASGQVQLQVTFVAQTAATLVLQANPSSVAPNVSGTGNQVTLTAQVRDVSGNAVAGKNVAFTANDPSGGTIQPATAVTGSNGIASTQFIPGAASTANNGVVVQATVQGTGVTGTTALTVNQQALFISIFAGNEISNLTQTTYQKEFAVLVNDANGAAVANKQVSLSVLPTVYRKGSLVFGTTAWVYGAGSPTICPNEDKNANGIVDPNEDNDATTGNNNGTLEPGLPVSVSAGSVTTDSTGRATFNLVYGENIVPWITVKITARATVNGTESSKVFTYDLAGAAADFTDAGVAPAGVRSPYGVATSCTDPN